MGLLFAKIDMSLFGKSWKFKYQTPILQLSPAITWLFGKVKLMLTWQLPAANLPDSGHASPGGAPSSHSGCAKSAKQKLQDPADKID